MPKVLKTVEGNRRNSAILHIGIFCAMRPSEVFGLRWSSFLSDYFVIRNSAWKGRLLEDETKGDERRVFIPPATLRAILRWREVCKHTRPGELVFASKKGNPQDAQAHPGHKTLAMTLVTYAQAIPDSVREMVERDERETLEQKDPATYAEQAEK